MMFVADLQDSTGLLINTDLELEMTALLGTETPNFYSEGFSKIPFRRTLKFCVLRLASAIVTSKVSHSSI